jgi:uncharacterized membrane protein
MDAAYLIDWANFLLRWLHVITAIAWIGSSFYFVFLDDSLEPPADEAQKARGVTGEMWAVHGGGFYNPQKYAVGPKTMPPNKLHWFYWESYSTWLSGFALFAVLYLWNASSFLVDPAVHDWTPAAAGAAAVGFLAAGWLVYDVICRVAGRTPGGGIGGDGRVGLLVLVMVVLASWLACRLFAGRAAFVLVGAMLATIMSANVLFWIIPGQRKVVAALRAGRAPDPIHGQRGKQRSVHNTYFTLPVLATMVSNHYPMLYQHAHNWLVLLGLMVLGVAVRVFFVQRHKGRHRWDLVAASVALAVALAVFIAPPRPSAASAATPAGFAAVQAVVQQRCAACHNEQFAQKGVRLDTPDAIRRQAAAIHQQAVVTRQMPQNNATQITEDERALLARWFAAGAPGP